MNDLPRDETVEQSDVEDKNIAKLCITDRAFSTKQPTEVKKAPFASGFYDSNRESRY
jgi:hypothetical protein